MLVVSLDSFPLHHLGMEVNDLVLMLWAKPPEKWREDNHAKASPPLSLQVSSPTLLGKVASQSPPAASAGPQGEWPVHI